MTATVRDLGPYLALVLVGFLPNEIWRVLGIVIARGLDESSELLVWVRAVATAVLAGIIAQLILTPRRARHGGAGGTPCGGGHRVRRISANAPFGLYRRARRRNCACARGVGMAVSPPALR
jgi:hypothetical protein